MLAPGPPNSALNTTKTLLGTRFIYTLLASNAVLFCGKDTEAQKLPKICADSGPVRIPEPERLQALSTA